MAEELSCKDSKRLAFILESYLSYREFLQFWSTHRRSPHESASLDEWRRAIDDAMQLSETKGTETTT
jgi:hypothetical protein